MSGINEVQFVEQILQWVKSGVSLQDININYPSGMRDGVRYDKCTVGYLYMPWLHNQSFIELYALAEKIETGSYEGMKAAPRAYIILKSAEMALLGGEGDFVECGVYKGGTALLASEVILKESPPNRPVFHLFDTFEGIPEQGLSDNEALKGRAAELADVSLEITQSNLTKYSDFLRFYPGYVPDTFEGFEKRPIRYLHVDINTAKAHGDCLSFFMPQLIDGAVVVFDDYGWPHYGECKEAIDDYFSAHGLPLPVTLMTGQGFYVHGKARKSLLGF